MIIKRQDYLNSNGKITHEEYFKQFVSEETKEKLLQHISLKELLDSKDEHLNDISAKRLDGISGVIFQSINGQEKLVAGPQVSRKLADKLYLTGEGISPAGLVCVYKATARELIKENK
ncbi:MAG: hypothetical protein M0R03_23315 [Novosphingobium sp.]|nr:hypothetical protein [Novosphingobium sp.]